MVDPEISKAPDKLKEPPVLNTADEDVLILPARVNTPFTLKLP